MLNIMEKKSVRRRGIMPPYNPIQIISWMIGISNITFVSIFYPKHCSSSFFPVFFYISFSLVAFFSLALLIIDPSDPMLKGKSQSPDSSITASCSICDSIVSPSSKHCGQCNRCVAHFDHHCKWLNTCIGRSNYCYFILLLTSLLLYMCELFVYSLDVSIKSIEKNDEITATFSLIFLAESAVALVLDLNLIGLHIYLKARGLTTYEYIVRKKQKVAQIKDDMQECSGDSDIDKTVTGGGIIFDGKKFEKGI
jgi:palmitoyltransferase